MSSALQEASLLSEMYSWLLLSNTVATLILLLLVGVNAFSLVQRLRRKEAGSRLNTRIVLLFIILSLVPAGVVFYYSLQFLNQSIDGWFNVEIDAAMDDALELSHASLEQRIRWNLNQSQQISERLNGKTLAEATFALEQVREITMASEITLLSKKGAIIAFSGLIVSDILPSLAVTPLFLQVLQGEDHVKLELINDELVVQALVAINVGDGYYLQIIYPIPERINELTDSVEFAYVRFQEMTYLRHSLKVSFSLVLSLVLLVSLLASILVAFISVREIIAPIRDLVRGTKMVAAGFYEQLLPVKRQDDLGFLVESFNDMVQQISLSRDEARISALEIEQQRAYLEALLSSLTSGVLSFDANLNIRKANHSANIILHLQLMRYFGLGLSSLAHARSDLQELVDVWLPLLEKSNEIWQRNIKINTPDGRKELLCQGSPLFSTEGGYIGAVVVFDDITDLIQAQKNAAWAEVARRLAHEIKNPLTPIQLAAERLQHKLADKLDTEDEKLLVRSIRTIVQQVEALKFMVDDFSVYAQSGRKVVENIDLRVIVREIASLYDAIPKIVVLIQEEKNTPKVSVDVVTIRQVLHNLFKNACEAMADSGQITIKIQSIVQDNVHFVCMSIYDTGCGVNINQSKEIFEPYVSHKEKGTGLGLAIAKKIIEEHGGSIRLDSHYKDGAGFIILFPAVLYLD
jgi:nitrogen fixation/metabolism regulation signal transduction histidine kinase